MVTTKKKMKNKKNVYRVYSRMKAKTFSHVWKFPKITLITVILWSYFNRYGHKTEPNVSKTWVLSPRLVSHTITGTLTTTNYTTTTGCARQQRVTGRRPLIWKSSLWAISVCDLIMRLLDGLGLDLLVDGCSTFLNSQKQLVLYYSLRQRPNAFGRRRQWSWYLPWNFSEFENLPLALRSDKQHIQCIEF